jgi:SAM-dependent methyltransferase
MPAAQTSPARPQERGTSPGYEEVRAFFDRFAAVEPHWRRRNRTYHALVEAICSFYVLPGSSVLEIGSGSGDLLARLRPARGVGVDVSPGMVELARSRHRGLEFVTAAGEELALEETFDYVVLSDLVPYVHDLLELFRRVAQHCHPGTRVVIHAHSQAWRPLLRLAELLRLKAPKPMRNWVAREDVANLLDLAGLEVVTAGTRILMPKRIPLVTRFLNGFLANLWPFKHFCLTYWLVARPRPKPLGRDITVSVVCPCRNEEGHVPDLVERLPRLGAATELIFVEGGSTDGTRAAIEREIERRPDMDIRLLEQPGRGKGDAVRAGFAAARHELLMILDGDLSVLPEDLSSFHRAYVDGRAELLNGSRLVYDLEPGSMRFLNLLGNKLFSRLLSAIVGQHVKDTLCGTKVLARADYERIAAGRPYFGDFDPFGDFDLLFGAGRLGLRIVDLPVRYHPRTYGRTNIHRFRHGLLLLQMTAFAFSRFKMRIFDARDG